MLERYWKGKDNLRIGIIYTVAGVFFALTILTFIKRGQLDSADFFEDMREHHLEHEAAGWEEEREFRKEMRGFMAEGPRNTAGQGEALCIRIGVLEGLPFEQAHQQCHEIYIKSGEDNGSEVASGHNSNGR